MRQWKALMKKNYINWKRQAKCSFFEICCPAAVMYLMVILRGVVDVESVNLDDLIQVKEATYPGLNWQWNDMSTFAADSTYGEWNYESLTLLNTDQTDFFKYGGYPITQDYTTDKNYNMVSDVLGPWYFLPTDCLKINSFQVPQVASPVIAIVGEVNAAQYMMSSYLETLTGLQ